MNYDRIRTANDVEERIKESIAFYDCRIKAWEKVKRIGKKSGGDYANFGMNFENAKIYAPHGLHNKLVVNFKDEHGSYQTDYIDICDSVDNQFKEISAVIEKYKGWKEESEKDLELAAALAEFTLSKIAEIKAEFKKSGANPNSSLYFALGHLIENSKYF